MSVDRAQADVAVLPKCRYRRYLFKIRSSVTTYLLISHTGYDPATAFGHTGMFRGTAPVGGPYPGMVPGATDTGLHRLVYVSYFGFYMS